MQKLFRILVCILVLDVIGSCGFNLSSSQKEIEHMQEYIFKDQSQRSELNKNQKFSDLNGCPILIQMSRWSYDKRWSEGTWIRSQSWMYPNEMISETDTSINDGDYGRPKDSILIYVGPWKEVTLTKGLVWRESVNKKIRFVAIQRKNDTNKGRIYVSYEFQTPQNINIKQKPITLYKELPTPLFENFCKVKWVAKYGYNAVFDQRRGKIIEMKE